MALGRYARVDGRRKSNYCSTVVIALLVSACLLGAWMAMTSPVSPTEIVRRSVGSTSDFIKQKVNDKIFGEFEDGQGELLEDGSKDDSKSPNSEIVGESGQEDNVGKSSSDADNKETEVESGKDEDNKNVKENSDSKTLGNEASPIDREETEENDSTPKTEEGEEKSRSEDISDVTKENIEKTKDETGSEREEQIGDDEIKDNKDGKSGSWLTQAIESEKQKSSKKSSMSKNFEDYKWKVCNVTAGPDYIPCLDNIKAIRKLPSRSHYEHRERHCPKEAPTCLVPLPEGYKTPVRWPKSREKIWFANVPHVKLAVVKGHQNWVQVSGEYITFPGGGTQFVHGATRYIDFIEQTLPDIAWGKRSRVVLDVGCGVASFGGFLFDKDVLTMSLAPKDEHEAQVQFALERGIPAISAVMGTKRLPFPGMAFDVVHCARCRVPWHLEGGKLLLELDRLLRPGGYFVWSATPVYRKDEENKGIWKAMSKLTKSMCWDLLKIGKDRVNGVSAAIYKKPISNDCYESRMKNEPPLCEESDNANAAWDVPLQACIHKVPTETTERGSQLPPKWPSRLEKPPYWLKDSETGVYGKEATKDFVADYNHWKHIFSDSYLDGIGVDWSSLRNVMDMRAIYGGFAAALKDLKVWVMNVVPVTSSDTLPIIYERGLFGIYHDWCESFNTYPRSYDLLHADHLLSNLKIRCKLVAVIAEIDRILRPGGYLIVKDDIDTIAEVERLAKSLQWKIKFSSSKDEEGLLCAQKTRWHPQEVETIKSAIA